MKVLLFALPSLLSLSLLSQSVADASRTARGDKTAPNGDSMAPNTIAARAAANALVVPEKGTVADGAYASKYFSLSYRAPEGWKEGRPGPPPSDNGYYVLSSFRPGPSFQGTTKGTILIAAWDLFFVPRPAHNAMELVTDMKATLPKIYSVDGPPAEVKIANRTFVRLDYKAADAQLHWRVLATEIRCHIVEFVFTSQNTALLDTLAQDMDGKIRLPFDADVTSGTGGDGSPRCIKDYATGANVVHKVDPVMAGPRYTSVPVRFIVGTDGKVRNIHVINGVPEQAQSIEAALSQWVLKPYKRNGVAEEIETGIVFKFPPEGVKLPPVAEKY